MALDAATLALTAGELKQTLTDAKIAKIFEPTRDELVLTLRTRTETYALLLSARSGSARVCLTEESFENPETPPSFCMLMRKHLTGGRLLDVQMEPGDRIVYFTFQCTNEMGDLVQNILCAELMGRYSNLVLVQNGKIIDALKRVDFEDSDVRQLLPGLPYTTPPKPARPDFLAVSSASIVAAACERDLPVADALNKTVAGVGPVVCREAAWRAFDGEHLPANELTDAQKRSLMAAIDELKELHAQGGEEASIVEREEVFGLLRRHSEHHRVVLAERQQRQRAVGREALPGAIAVRRRGADFGDHRVLAVVTDADFGVALRCAFCMDDEFGRDLLRGVTTRDRHQGIAVVGADADDIARRQPLLRRNTRVERRCEVAVAHDVAERRRAVVGSVDHRTAEAAALRYVDFLDRCAGGCVPRAQAFEQLPAAVRERQAAWVVGPDAARAAVEQMDALAPVSEC